MIVLVCAVKICGLTSIKAIDAAVSAGADMLGFVFFPSSPRSLDFETAEILARHIPDEITLVALSVDADNLFLEAIASRVKPDVMQLHGKETPCRVSEVQNLFGLPVMKAVGISGPDDVNRAFDFAAVADQIMFDTKPPPNATRPGGNAIAFDWSLIAAKEWPVPWMLAGGLTPNNVAEAIAASGAPAVDVSSGVEDASGTKDPTKIFSFITAAKGSSLASS